MAMTCGVFMKINPSNTLKWQASTQIVELQSKYANYKDFQYLKIHRKEQIELSAFSVLQSGFVLRAGGMEYCR